MASRSMKRTMTGVGSLLVSVLISACGVLNPPDAGLPSGDAQAVGSAPDANTSAVSATPVRSPVANVRAATVKKDSIAETMAVDGLVAAQQQVSVTYPGSGKVQDVKVKPGQSVSEGDVLLEIDSVELSRSLAAAQARLQTSKANIAQAQASQLAQQRTAAQRAAAAQTQAQEAIASAQAGVRQAQDQLKTIMAGPSEVDRHAAENGVASAQAALQKAQAAQDKLSADPDPGDVRKAQADVANAQIVVDRAKGDLDVLTKGPDSVTLDAAQRDVDRANTQLQLTLTAKPDPKLDPASAKLAQDSAVADGQLAVQQAEARLAKLKQPPAPVDVQSARQRLQSAQDALGSANDRLAAVNAPADQSALDAAQATVDQAQQGVDDAQARLKTLVSHPTPAEAAAGQEQVRRAQAALDAARNSTVDPNADPGGVDLGSLQEAINQDQAAVDSLQQQLQNSRITAPITGTVVAVRAKPGDTITSARPVFILATPGAPIVRAQLTDEEAARLASGQKASVQLDDGSGKTAQWPASVGDVTPAKDGAAAVVDLTVKWPADGSPKIGLPVQISVTVQEKPQVLVVPKNAVRQTSGKSYVEVLDGTSRRLTSVQVGITGSDKVEIVSGLTEGQTVVLTS
jgi:RND family efflux transporter MFP subunit